MGASQRSDIAFLGRSIDLTGEPADLLGHFGRCADGGETATLVQLLNGCCGVGVVGVVCGQCEVAQSAQGLLDQPNIIAQVAGPEVSVHGQVADQRDHRAIAHHQDHVALVDRVALGRRPHDHVVGRSDGGRGQGHLGGVGCAERAANAQVGGKHPAFNRHGDGARWWRLGSERGVGRRLDAAPDQ